MKKILLAAILAVSFIGTKVHAEGMGGGSGGFGGALGISVPDALSGLPNGVDHIDGAKVDAFWSCFFAPKCNAFKLDLSQYSDEEVKEDK